jgi:tetraacyldisaccharide 4'-kinase
MVKNGWKRIIEGRAVGHPAAGWLLKGISLPYLAGAEAKNIAFDRGWRTAHRLPARVVSVGNLSVGGTGKTPLTLALARYYKNAGVPAAIVSRGYGGSAERDCVVASDGVEVFHGPDRVGDEPYLLAKISGVPVLVGRDRVRSGLEACRRFSARVILLDDGFQHRRLARDLDLVLLDARKSLEREWVLPAGTLREPLRSLKRAHALILTRYDDGAVSRKNREFLGRGFPDVPAFMAEHRPEKFIVENEEIPLERIQGRKAVAFSGLGANETFFETMRSLGADIRAAIGFDDHHVYTDADVQRLTSLKRKLNAEVLVTTGKDAVKMTQLNHPDFTPWVLRIGFHILENEDSFFRLVKNELV